MAIEYFETRFAGLCLGRTYTAHGEAGFCVVGGSVLEEWLVRLEGDHVDLAHLACRRLSTEWEVREMEGHYHLMSSAFKSISGAEEVRSEATGLVEGINGLTMLSEPSYRAVKVGHILRLHSDGRQDAFVFVSNTLTLRARALTVAVSVSGEQS